MSTPSRITFVTCLLGAPTVFGILIIPFFLGGDYLARFGQAGALGLIFSIPTWLTAFPYLSWNAAKQKKTQINSYVFASLGANAASLVIIPILIFLAEWLGADLSGKLAESLKEARETNNIKPTEFSLPAASAIAGFAAFFVGLFVLPILGALFGWLAKMLKLVRVNPA